MESDKEEFQSWEDDGDERSEKLDGLDEVERRPKYCRWRKTKKNTKCCWSVDDMFEANKNICVGESSYDENLSQYSKYVLPFEPFGNTIFWPTKDIKIPGKTRKKNVKFAFYFSGFYLNQIALLFLLP